ncbi:hypothetical protein ACFX2H_004398 [Malus domestica]
MRVNPILPTKRTSRVRSSGYLIVKRQKRGKKDGVWHWEMGWAESIGLRLLGWELGLRPVLKNGSRAFCCKLKKRSLEEQQKLAENSTLEEEED